MEVTWGRPMTLVLSPQGDKQKFSTIEQADHWLRRKWPLADRKRDAAIALVEAAMNCLVPVAEARRAFVSAAITAGFRVDRKEG
ncbi:DUF982 domain-containing protein [Pseudooceanicola nanhaiensis]|nr:DUF982 domain-containing protein [Pseudooceanicola nanhaiensis]